MNRVGSASTAARRSLCENGTASSSRACARSTRGRPRAAATRSSRRRYGRKAAASKRPKYSRSGSPARSRLSRSSRPASRDGPSAGHRSTSERNRCGWARAASTRKHPPMLAPRAASHGASLAASSASPAATASCQPSGPITPSLSPWPRKSKVSAASPAAAACSPMMPWFSLRLPAPWHTRREPRGRPRGSLLVCHGAGSRKENHGIMGEQAAAAGLAALTFDFRGHGESDGVMGPEGWHDAVAAGEALLAASDAPWLAARGASMGGCFLVLAARAHPHLFRALVLLCPADGPSLLAGLDDLESRERAGDPNRCLLYTSDAADDLLCVDLGGR